MLFVPYQRSDFGVPLPLSKLQRSTAIISLEVNVTARSKELRCDGRMPTVGRDSSVLTFAASPNAQPRKAPAPP